MTSDWCQGGSLSPCLRTFLARCDAWHGVTLSARDSPTLVTPSSDALCDSCRGKWYQNMKTLQGSNYHETVATHPGAAGWYLSWRVESADKSLWVFWLFETLAWNIKFDLILKMNTIHVNCLSTELPKIIKPTNIYLILLQTINHEINCSLYSLFDFDKNWMRLSRTQPLWKFMKWNCQLILISGSLEWRDSVFAGGEKWWMSGKCFKAIMATLVSSSCIFTDTE